MSFLDMEEELLPEIFPEILSELLDAVENKRKHYESLSNFFA